MRSFNFITVFILFFISIIITYISSDLSKKIIPVGYGFKKFDITSKGDIFNFALLDHNGVFQELYRQPGSGNFLIVASDFDCPSFPELVKELNQIDPGKLSVLLINANDNSYRKSLINTSNVLKNNIPILMDTSNSVLSELNFKRVGDFVVTNRNGWKRKLSGNLFEDVSIINQFIKAFPNQKALKLTKMLNKCNLNLRKVPNEISYEKVIVPILMSKCLSCHSKSGSIPPYFDSFDKIRNWRQMSKETILTGRMPPISFDPYYGEYFNDISLSDDEKLLLVQWFSQKSNLKVDSDPIKKYKPDEPRHVNPKDFLYAAEMENPHEIPPSGETEYKYFQLGGPVPFDMWVRGYKTISSNPRQLHHESLMITSKPLSFYEDLENKWFKRDQKAAKIAKKTDGDIFLFTLRAIETYEEKYSSDTYLRMQTWGAGRKVESFYQKRVGAFIPKGSYLILETHYMGTGRTEFEKTKIEFYGSRTKPPKVSAIRSYNIVSAKIAIPPNVNNYEVKTPYWSPKRDIRILSFLGHLHMRGKSVKLVSTTKEGETKIIVSIPNFYYGWQTGANLRALEPILVKSTDKLQTICTYDNSVYNPFNPDPNKVIRHGQRVDRTEMCRMGFGYIFNQDYED